MLSHTLSLLFLSSQAYSKIASTELAAQTTVLSNNWAPGSGYDSPYAVAPSSIPTWSPKSPLAPNPNDYAPRGCRVPAGDRLINSYQLYPENADFDPRRCVMYFSVLWNTSVAVWDPIRNRMVGSITDRRFTGRPDLHASGVQLDMIHDKLSIMFNAGNAFDTLGKDIAGENNLVQYDLRTNRVEWAVDLSRATKGAYSAFQDMEHDRYGNVFACGTFPPSLMFVNATSRAVVPWWLGPNNPTIVGITGLAMWRYSKLLATYREGYGPYRQQLIRFDVRRRGEPTVIPVLENGRPARIGENLDAIYLPLRYGGNVLLVSDGELGTIVLYSNDGWETSRKLGAVPSPFKDATRAVATVQAGLRIFCVFEFFQDAVVRVPGQPAGAGSRSRFPLMDITDQIDSLMPPEMRHVYKDGSY